MKYKGKIVQIIEEKNAKGYILDWQQSVVPNYDYLNIRPAGERQVPNKYRWLFGLSIIFFCALIIIFSTAVFDIGIISWISVILLALDVYIGLKENKRYVHKFVQKGWYINDAFPVEKPHNYKVGDLVDVELNLSKSKELKWESSK